MTVTTCDGFGCGALTAVRRVVCDAFGCVALTAVRRVT